MPGLLFSVIIITRNRKNKIPHTLSSVKRLTFPADSYELIIVDNGSTDGTAAAARESLMDSALRFDIVTENMKGICRARNKGLENAAGEWVLYLDDDVLVPENLLETYREAIEAYPEAVAFGGPGRLDPAIPRPWWWIPDFEKTMSCQNYGDTAIVYPRGANPYGLNMLINREVLAAASGFDLRMDDLTSSFADETEMFMRLKLNGGVIMYIPEAEVIHSVLPDRLEWRNFMHRFRLVGRSHACLDFLHKTNHFRSLPRRMLSSLVLYLRHRSPAVFFTELSAWSGYRQFAAPVQAAKDDEAG